MNNKLEKTINLFCYCSVSPWNLSGQAAHIKIDNKLVCTKCGRGA